MVMLRMLLVVMPVMMLVMQKVLVLVMSDDGDNAVYRWRFFCRYVELILHRWQCCWHYHYPHHSLALALASIHRAGLAPAVCRAAHVAWR